MDPQKQIANFWNQFVKAYSTIEQNLSIQGITLLNLLHIQDAKSILEVGCGTGFMTGLILTYFKNQETTLTSIDLAPEMIDYTKRSMFHKLTKKEAYNEEEALLLFKQMKLSLEIGDIEDLSQFQDQTFDIYHSNLVFHITTDTLKALKESYRVLRKGGRLGFSVWGRREYSPFYTMIKKTLIECGYEVPQGKDQFKYGEDKEGIKKQLEEIGYKNILIWNQTSPVDRLTPEEYIGAQNPKFQALIESDQQKSQLFKQKLQEKYNHQLNELREPFMIDIVMVIAYKK